MSDIIKLLPDSVANQIAAGEVVQRPASVAKELLENAVDAGATEIQLIVKDAGSTLVQVIDNGCGMSETDARMCFERHATSKISSASDLFAIRTLGFRGEAMASIAAVSQVEMRTRTAASELGTEILIDGSRIKHQTPCSSPVGTSTAVKNLFFNVPARRKFLKKPSTELQHIVDEFIRVAMVNCNIAMTLTNDGNTIYQLHKSTPKQRIVDILGKEFNKRLLSVETISNYVKITGFVGKPENARKNRNNQYFFVNNRFIKSPFLNHAVEKSYKELLPESSFPAYCIFLEMSPENVDINTHPAKTEVKFTDEQMMYAFITAAVKKSLGQFSITPSIDFEDNPGFNIIPGQHRPAPPPAIHFNPDYNPFEAKTTSSGGGGLRRETSKDEPVPPEYLDKLFGTESERSALKQLEYETFAPVQHVISPNWDEDEEAHNTSEYLQIGTKYIATNVKSGIMLIDRQRAFERIFFERNLKKSESDNTACQRLMFPKTIELNPKEMLKMKELEPSLQAQGFDLADFGQNTFIIHGIPAVLPLDADIASMFQELLDDDAHSKDVATDKKAQVALFLARNMAARRTGKITQEEINILVNELFTTSVPDATPDGLPVIKTISFAELDIFF
ncbi:MAG: DNA mismatch repair endonuclease MutL [Bacteroidales bacterium]|nr:DNA mismatch repair endonuclease MutL [Bacteroidales bacterium]